MFPLGSINHDEPVYTFAARLLRAGHLTLPQSYAPYRPWASGVHDGHVVLKYTPVWPGVLAAGSAVGSMRLAVAAVAAAAVVLTGLLGRELFGRWTEGLLAATMLVLSPLFLVQEGTFLSYLFQLVLDLAILLLVLGALRRWPAHGRPPRAAVVRLVGGGAVWGVAAFARQYDAVLIAVPLVLAALTIGLRTPRRLAAWIGWSALGAAVPLAALFTYNWVLLGSPLRNSFSITGKYDTLLFGQRGVFPSTVFTFTGGDAAVSFVRNLTELPNWVFGGVLLVALAAFGLWRSRRLGAGTWVLTGVGVSFAVGYAVFWSPYSIVALWPGVQTMGPFYHLALLIPLTLFGAAGLAALFERTRVGTIAVVVTMIAMTGIGFNSQVRRNLQVTHQYRAAKLIVDRVERAGPAPAPRAVLFLEDAGDRGYESAQPFLENRPDLNQPVVYAVDNGSDNFRVMKELPDRVPYRLRAEIRAGDGLWDPTPFLEKLSVRSGQSVSLRFRIVNTVGAPIVSSLFHTGAIDQSVVLDRNSKKGDTYIVEWTLVAFPWLPGAPTTTIALPDSSGLAEIEADFWQPAGFLQPARAPERYELQYPYIVADGHAQVLMPGWGRYLLQYNNPVWLNQDVSPTLKAVPPVTNAPSSPSGPSPLQPDRARDRRSSQGPSSTRRG